ncbi:putative leucine-rich repeat receptor-like protein kinase At2g19210 [Cucumis melo]|uniref:non-specific serine/threonine protein kinase n=1 Tax=Cucumis melo TaxID=3656 RepID=A0A1S3CGW6_CUCME|nr:putative leucine-rich repeat receptor-like protein kinase At2g19210 [Cucumis melo]XP_050948005.1 putative leucine-rich repeat receptor-like protein kinase At2g19210 [Cucumis melo]
MPRLLLLYAFLPLLLVHVDGQDQSGFISIDCGIPANSNYTDDITTLKYVSDAEFIDTGEIHDISPEYSRKLDQSEFNNAQLRNLRSFPEGNRSCYTIRQGSGGEKYLIRVSFMYGNYDNIKRPPTFDLYLGVDYWDSVHLSKASEIVRKELIHVPTLDYMQICLINIQKGVPFISAIEIRPLDNSTYVTVSGSLMLHQRLDYGSESNQTVRYPNDSYDRIWSSSTLSGSKNISSNSSIESNGFAIPSIVLETAVTPKRSHQPLNISWNTRTKMDQFYIYMHFADIHKMVKGELRAFDILVNGFLWYGQLAPTYLSTTTVYSGSGTTAANGGKLECSLKRNENSSFPPLINAIEIFVQKQFPQLQTDQAEIEALLNIKLAYNLKNWQGDPCYPQKYAWTSLNCSYISDSPPKIISLNLSSSGLAGGISSRISILTMLQYLDLSNNHLNGTVPDFLASLPFLRVLNLANNNLSGIIPQTLIERSRKETLALSAEGNPYLCLSEPCSKKKKEYIIPLAASLGGVTLALLTGGAIVWSQRRRKKKEKQISGSSKQGETLLVPENTKFTYSEILSITNNFERVIGKGGFGTVYHGYLHSIQVSVKMLSPTSVQGYKQFEEEAQLLTTVHHGNLTSVLGYCNEDTHLGLVYEHMENGNLADLLSEKSNHILNWKERLRIALDAAQGLEYLHFGCKPPIIHRDLKSTNILVDKNLHAKLADFGLSKAFHSEDGAQASAAVGTPGYLDPEYTVTNKLNEKSDVYSFGVILLEIVTGQPAITKTQDKTNVIKRVISVLKEGEIKNTVDPKIGLDINNSSIWKFIELAMACVSSSSSERPTMTQVVMELKQCLAILENSQENNGGFSSSLVLVPLSSSIRDPQER